MASSVATVAFGCFVVMMLLQMQCGAAQTTYIVGDSMGWKVPTGDAAAYTSWAAGKTFVVGDILSFNFNTNAHDVLRVPKASFDSCSSSNGIGVMITTGPANVTLKSAGEHYYICTIDGHCLGGQKLAINVSAGAPGVSPAPSTTLTPPPASSSSKVLASHFVTILASIIMIFFY